MMLKKGCIYGPFELFSWHYLYFNFFKILSAVVSTECVVYGILIQFIFHSTLIHKLTIIIKIIEIFCVFFNDTMCRFRFNSQIDLILK
jgi:hypothetical protein